MSKSNKTGNLVAQGMVEFLETNKKLSLPKPELQKQASTDEQLEKVFNSLISVASTLNSLGFAKSSIQTMKVISSLTKKDDSYASDPLEITDEDITLPPEEEMAPLDAPSSSPFEDEDDLDIKKILADANREAESDSPTEDQSFADDSYETEITHDFSDYGDHMISLGHHKDHITATWINSYKKFFYMKNGKMHSKSFKDIKYQGPSWSGKDHMENQEIVFLDHHSGKECSGTMIFGSDDSGIAVVEVDGDIFPIPFDNIISSSTDQSFADDEDLYNIDLDSLYADDEDEEDEEDEDEDEDPDDIKTFIHLLENALSQLEGKDVHSTEAKKARASLKKLKEKYDRMMKKRDL